jgi:ubiquitin-like-conjugating enzyme ATG3
VINFNLREKGDPSKVVDFLPPDKQYLVIRGVPCLRRATSLAYTDADEDAERMLSFADSSTPGNDGEDWVETHAGRKSTLDSAANPGVIDDIPDLDGDGPQDVGNVVNAMGTLSVSESKGAAAAETPNLDDIPDMEEEDLEAGDEATAAPKAAAPASGVIDPRYAFTMLVSYLITNPLSAKFKWPTEIYCKCERTTS